MVSYGYASGFEFFWTKWFSSKAELSLSSIIMIRFSLSLSLNPPSLYSGTLLFLLQSTIWLTSVLLNTTFYQRWFRFVGLAQRFFFSYETNVLIVLENNTFRNLMCGIFLGRVQSWICGNAKKLIWWAAVSTESQTKWLNRFDSLNADLKTIFFSSAICSVNKICVQTIDQIFMSSTVARGNYSRINLSSPFLYI